MSLAEEYRLQRRDPRHSKRRRLREVEVVRHLEQRVVARGQRVLCKGAALWSDVAVRVSGNLVPDLDVLVGGVGADGDDCPGEVSARDGADGGEAESDLFPIGRVLA